MRTTTRAPEALRALLESIIDYAGLFPPAQLDMASTVRNYAAYRQGEDAWMLARLIVPVARLDEFEKQAEALLPRGEASKPWLISALTADAGSPSLQNELKRIEDFNERHSSPPGGLALIDVVEMKGSTPAAIDMMMDALPDELFAFFEIPIGGDVRGLIACMAGCDAGAKVRTGGLTADAYPGVDRLAQFIEACAAASVPFKATAGLHHPLRHRHGSVDVFEHGFINVFAAACFARGLGETFDAGLIAGLLSEERADSFAFDDEGMRWRDYALDASQIEQARGMLGVSFGSCSFDEPRDDLRALGLL